MQKIDSKKEHNSERNSAIELFRIITMIIIVAHHYVVNSGLIDMIQTSEKTWRSYFLLILGWGGKTGINCFVFITGYFMCQSNITWKKFLKLLFEVEFYTITIYLIFLITGYSQFSITTLIKAIFPIYGIGTGFTHSFLVFYLFIPFVNVLIKNLEEKQHLSMLLLCLIIFTIFPTFCFAEVAVSYVGWFIVIYLIAAYIRLYPKKVFNSKKNWGIATCCSVFVSWCSVIIGEIVGEKVGMELKYFFVSDSNKLLALVTAFCAFLYFKNLNIRKNKIINTVAASTFGVLMIHANSDSMRQWLWKDVFQNTSYYESDFLVLHTIITILLIYAVCTCIDILRIKLVEKPMFDWIERKTRKGERLI